MMPYRDGSQEIPFYEYVRQNLVGFAKDVEIHPPPDRLAKVQFPIGEGALALVDDTILRSRKAGLLLTAGALYTLADGRRLDLSIVLGGPYYPNGEDGAAIIETSHGPFVVAALTQDYSRDALHRIVEIVVAWNHGERSSPHAEFAHRGPITQAAMQLLHTAPDVLPPWGLRQSKREGLRQFSRGMDHPGAEEVLAIIDETALGKCDEGMVFTDRAVHVRAEAASAPNDFYRLPYANLSNVTHKGSLIGKELLLATSWGPREMSLVTASDATDAVYRFLMTVLQIPPHLRRDPRPAGSLSGDRMLHACVDGLGLTPELAGDFHARLELQYQNTRWGRGESQGWALSPLSLGDLRAALPYVLGQPYGEHWDGTVLTLDFSLRQSSGAGKAIASSVVGLALLATVGIGWISVPKGPTVTAVRCRAVTLPSGSGLAVVGLSGHTELTVSAVANTVDSGLVPVEQEILRRRCILGTEMPAAHLLAIDDASVARRASELCASRAASTAGR